MKYYIVYQTINTINNKIYIGVHGTNDPNVFDGYIGCGVNIFSPTTYKHPSTPFQYAVKKYGVKKFKRTTLRIFTNEKEAYKLEAELVNEEFIKRQDTYNLILGGRSTLYANPTKNIYMYSLDGVFEQEFNSIIEAVRFLDPNAKSGGHIIRAIKKGHQFLGHQFSYIKLPYMKPLKYRHLNTVDKPYTGNKVGKYNEYGHLIHVYNNMTECVKDGYANAKLVAIGRRKKCKGFIFKYLD